MNQKKIKLDGENIVLVYGIDLMEESIWSCIMTYYHVNLLRSMGNPKDI